MPSTFLYAWSVLLGAVVGSFLNVVIARVPKGESVVRPRSRCPKCQVPIAWYDNVPVVSFLLLRARCRSCGAPISWRYPLVELLGAAAALLAVVRQGFSGAAAAEFAFVLTLVALAFIDTDTWLLPHALTWPLMVAGQGAAALGLSSASPRSSALGLLLGVLGFAAVRELGQRAFKKEALGYGDVWLLGGIGAWLGASALLPVVLLASLQGAVVGGALLLLGRGTPGPDEGPRASGARGGGGEEPAPQEEEDWIPPRHAVPFGPFLAAAALEWLYLSHVLARLVPALSPFT